MNRYSRASAAANNVHDNIVNLYTMLDTLHRMDRDATPTQANYLLHNLLNLEGNVHELRHALITLDVVKADPVQNIIEAAIAVGRMAEHVGDEWHRTGHQPESTIDLVEENGVIGGVPIIAKKEQA